MRGGAVLVFRQAWVVWSFAGLAACARVAPSVAPLSAGPAPEPPAPEPPAAASTGNAASAAAPTKPASAKASSPGKLGKRALYQRSCDLGSAVGCNDLAILLGLESTESAPLFERACSLGLTRGCANLGTQLLRRDPDEKTRDHAVELLSRACDASDWYGCAELGDALYAALARSGPSVLGRAHAAYEKACQLGAMDACSSDGWMFRNGEGTSKNPERARELFRLACDHQSYTGCAALGYDLMQGAKNRDEYADGTRWSKVACEHNDAFGCFSLGAAMLASGTPKALEDGLSLLKRSCALGLANACRFAEGVEKRLKSGPPPAAKTPAAGSDDAEEDDEDEGAD